MRREDLAAKAGVSISTVIRIENATSDALYGSLTTIAAALDTTLVVLLRDSETAA